MTAFDTTIPNPLFPVLDADGALWWGNEGDSPLVARFSGNLSGVPTITRFATGVPNPVTAVVDARRAIWFGNEGDSTLIVRVSGDLLGTPTISTYDTGVVDPLWPVLDRHGNIWFGNESCFLATIIRVTTSDPVAPVAPVTAAAQMTARGSALPFTGASAARALAAVGGLLLTLGIALTRVVSRRPISSWFVVTPTDRN